MEEAILILNSGAEGKELRLGDPSTFRAASAGFGLNVRPCQRAEKLYVGLAQTRAKNALRLTRASLALNALT